MRDKILGLILLALILIGPPAEANFACGLKPLRPIGCAQGEAVCVCDEYGCRWVWICNT